MKIPVLSVKDNEGNIISIPAIQGPKGDPGETRSVNGVQCDDQGNIVLTSTNIPHENTTVGAELNNLNDALDDKQDKLVDYIVEQGTSGAWNYTKWQSGNVLLSCTINTYVTQGSQTATAAYPFDVMDAVIQVTPGYCSEPLTVPPWADGDENAVNIHYIAQGSGHNFYVTVFGKYK